MRIQHNIAALNAYRQLTANNNAVSKNLEKLSSGYKINRAGDDAAGLAISEKMRGQIRGLDQATNNANDGISLVQTAEGGLNETASILQRMRELAVQSSNGTYQNDVDRENLNKEVTSLKSEIDRIASSTHFNKINLLDGSLNYSSQATATYGTTPMTFLGGTGTAAKTVAFADGSSTAAGTIAATFTGGNLTVTLGTQGGTSTYTADQITQKVRDLAKADGSADALLYTNFEVKFDGTISNAAAATTTVGATTLVATPGAGELKFQIGANGTSDQQVSLMVGDMSTAGLSLTGVSVATQDDAISAIATIDNAINQVSGTRADLGALQNRLEHTVNNLGVTSENLTSAESRIRD
ncbi:MAG: flagellin protein, partial [Clostridiales bacterium]|nr:flagellin protein [Clostridiales bacterium]